MKKITVLKLTGFTLFLLVMAFSSKPLLSLAQESTSEVDDKPIKQIITASEEASLASDSATIDELLPEITGQVLSAVDELNIKPDEIVVDEEATHQCKMEDFSQKVKRGSEATFTFDISTEHPEEIIKNTYYLGDLPTGTTGQITGSASKFGKKYDVVLSASEFAQRGSFNIPVFYKETDNDQNSSTTVCQFNLIVE